MSHPHAFPFPFRQIHLDFHTSPHIKDVGEQFDAEAFARTMADANVNSVTVFAKCHHGHLYYDTDRPERHPGLRRDLDLLRQQVDALHARGIRAPIYISVQCDEYAADNHPEWIAKQEDGRPVGPGPFAPGWQILDMSSPYQEFLAEQTQEVLEKFKPVDGIFFDMCWDQVSFSHWAVDKMLARGMNPELAEDRAAYAHQVSLDYMKRFSEMVRRVTSDATVFFNARPLYNLAEEHPYLAQVEIEALPTGGWGYMYFPKNVRFARSFGLPYLGMTARFHRSWADFGGLKPQPALEYETAQMIAHGARCSIGDQLHPRGTTDPAAYELIGRVYRRVKEREPWCEGATPLAQIGVMLADSNGRPRNTIGTDEGAVRVLQQLRHQFDLIGTTSEFSKYQLLVLPDVINVDGVLAAKISKFLDAGGAVLASGMSGSSPDGQDVTLRDLGIVSTGPSPFTQTYVRFGKRIEADVPHTDHIFYERGINVIPAPGSISLASVVEPYFERTWQHFCSHKQTPPDRLTKSSAAVLNEPRRCAYIAYPIFGMLARNGNATYRLMVRNIINLILPDPILRAGGPTGLETSVMRQGDRTIVHLLYYAAERRTPDLDLIEDVVPLFDVPVSLKLDRAPKKVYLAPENRALEFTYTDGRADVRVPEIRGHAMIVFE